MAVPVRYIRDAAGRRWIVDLLPPEPILGAGLGIAPAIREPHLRTQRVRFTPEDESDEPVWGTEEYEPAARLEGFSDAKLLALLAAAQAG